nr:MAG TPA: hypothetical protein [Caudoviricetes sp.]
MSHIICDGSMILIYRGNFLNEYSITCKKFN